MTQIQIAYFITDHFLGGQLPLGVVFDGPEGRLVVANPRTPDERCVGGAAALFTWQRARALLAQHTGHELPIGVGPHVTLSAPVELPAGARYDTYANGLFASVVDKPAERGARGVHRTTAGMRFMSSWGVARHVKTRFKAGQALRSAKHLAPISQYVDGQHTTLLLEPLAFDLRGLTRTITDVATRLGAYARAVEVDGAGDEFKLQVYALEGGSQEDLHRAFDALAPFAEVVDISVPRARDNVLEQIRAHGDQGQAGQARIAIIGH